MVGRNDLCPCGSGKKHKHCCIDKTGPISLPWPVFPEEIALDELLKNDPLFRKYYDEHRDIIKTPITWAHDTSLPEGIDYRNSVLESGERIIRLRNIPARLTDSIKIAHELHHSVLDEQGFPNCIITDQRFENLASALSSMLLDLVIEEKQKEMGFDIVSDYEREMNENRRQLSLLSPPRDHFGKCHWLFNYCGNLLSWNVITDEPSVKHEFHVWFDNRFPDISKEAHELFESIGDLYKTPQQMYEVFTRLIKTYKLTKYMRASLPIK